LTSFCIRSPEIPRSGIGRILSDEDFGFRSTLGGFHGLNFLPSLFKMKVNVAMTVQFLHAAFPVCVNVPAFFDLTTIADPSGHFFGK